MPETPSNRRDLLTGRTFRAVVESAQDALADQVLAADKEHQAGATVRLATRAMGTEFGLLLDQEQRSALWPASAALEVIGEIERELTVYRDDSDVSRLNATGADTPMPVSESLWRLLANCRTLTEKTGGGFDVATQAQIALWQRCRRDERLPSDSEVAEALACSGITRVIFDEAARTVAFDRDGIGFNFGAIGKGEALDVCGERLEHPSILNGDEAEDDPLRAAASPLRDFCLFGGHSSIVARGRHGGHEGWPIGLGNPLFTRRRLGTLLLKDRAMATSGSNVQFYRYEGKRYGHILDPRTARPAEGLLSVTVLAPTAAMADALSTAFFVLGVEKSCEVCDNDPSIGVLLIPPPDRGGRLRPVIRGISDEILFLDPEQAVVPL